MKKFLILLMALLTSVIAQKNGRYPNSPLKEEMSDVPWVINKDDYIPFAANRHYFFNGGISDFTLNDTIQMQSHHPDASKVTFGKIMLESLGGVVGGYIMTNICRRMSLFHSSKAPWWAPSEVTWGDPHYLIGFSLGPPLLLTLVGHQLVNSKGSFLKSSIGSTAGSLLGAGFFILSLSRFAGADWSDSGYKAVTVDGIILLLLPITGAVIGYNLNISKKSVVPMISPEESEFLDGSSQRHDPLIKLQLITLRF